MVIEVKQNGKFVKIPYITADVPVSEAPIDGKQYARQDATWSEIVIPEVDLTEIETNIATNTAAIDTKVDKIIGKQLSTEDYTTEDKTKVSDLPTPDSIVVTTDPRLTVATTTKDGLMSAADKVQLDSTLTATEIENKVNAAVSSVYRVKGTVATVANLPTTGVAIGDVWNIADNGANYVATNNNPVEWDKLSETVDLSPYMQTSTANSTFVKKAGDTMTGDLIIKSSKAATIDGTDKINVRNPLVSNQHCSLNNNGLDIFSPDTSANGGISYLDSTGNSFIGFIGARVTGDTLNRLFLGWGKDPANTANQFYVNENDIKYKNINVALTEDSKTITIHRNPNSSNKAMFFGSGINIIPLSTSNATGINWRKQDDSDTTFSTGAVTLGDDIESGYLYMGWKNGEKNAYDSNYNFAVGKNRFTYKNNAVWHAGNDGAGSGLDADTVDGIHAANFFTNNIKSITADSIANGATFQELLSGSYPVFTGSSASALFSFKCSSASTSAIQFHANYDGSSINYRTQIDNNRYTNWQNVSLGPSTAVVTQAEYNALGSTVNSDGKIYFIKE